MLGIVGGRRRRRGRRKRGLRMCKVSKGGKQVSTRTYKDGDGSHGSRNGDGNASWKTAKDIRYYLGRKIVVDTCSTAYVRNGME